MIPDRNSLAAQAAALVSGQQDIIANAANLSSLLFYALDEVNWVGFYFRKGNNLVVGPFQGRPACVTNGYYRKSQIFSSIPWPSCEFQQRYIQQMKVVGGIG